MKFLSLFSGIEACSVAWGPLGWKCVGFSEIEPFPCSLLSHYYPHVPNLGDITKITEEQIVNLGNFDVLVFGSPCTNLSVAGNRRGFEGTQSVLFYEALRIFNYARKHNRCRFALWENVPGAFSSNKGNDFTAVVREMAGLQDVTTPDNGWGNSGVALGENGLLEWRVLDAQYFGLAQRRKRVFAILDTGDWRDRPPILFEQESVRGDNPASRETGGKFTTPTNKCSNAGSNKVTIVHGTQHPIISNDLAHCLGCNNGQENVLAYTIHGDTTPKISTNLSGTLRSQGGGGIVPPSVVYGFNGKHLTVSNDLSPTLIATGYKEPMSVVNIAGNIIGRSYKNGGNQLGVMENDISYTLTTEDRHAVCVGSVVRKLLPTECEVLMGFPRGYTDISHKGKPASNAVRYKALGNSMAVPVMRWIGEQIQYATNYNKQQDQQMLIMMTQSPTSLSTFNTCPKQYEAKYITKEVQFEQNEHAKFGDLLHKSIEMYLNGLEPLPVILKPLQPTLARMRGCLVGAEVKLGVTREGQAVDFFDKSAYQRCIVDAILSNADQSVFVCIDWKTGKKREAKIQHDFIKRCMRAKYPNAKIIVLFLYLFQGKYDREELPVECGVNSMWDLQNLMNNLQATYASGEFKPKKSGLCLKWCDVLSCPYNGKND